MDYRRQLINNNDVISYEIYDIGQLAFGFITYDLILRLMDLTLPTTKLHHWYLEMKTKNFNLEDEYEKIKQNYYFDENPDEILLKIKNIFLLTESSSAPHFKPKRLSIKEEMRKNKKKKPSKLNYRGLKIVSKSLTFLSMNSSIFSPPFLLPHRTRYE